MMADGYGFLRSSDYNYQLLLMIFVTSTCKSDFWFENWGYGKGGSLSKEGEDFPLGSCIKN
jgi:hypothetical protein